MEDNNDSSNRKIKVFISSLVEVKSGKQKYNRVREDLKN